MSGVWDGRARWCGSRFGTGRACCRRLGWFRGSVCRPLAKQGIGFIKRERGACRAFALVTARIPLCAIAHRRRFGGLGLLARSRFGRSRRACPLAMRELRPAGAWSRPALRRHTFMTVELTFPCGRLGSPCLLGAYRGGTGTGKSPTATVLAQGLLAVVATVGRAVDCFVVRLVSRALLADARARFACSRGGRRRCQTSERSAR